MAKKKNTSFGTPIPKGGVWIGGVLYKPEDFATEEEIIKRIQSEPKLTRFFPKDRKVIRNEKSKPPQELKKEAPPLELKKEDPAEDENE